MKTYAPRKADLEPAWWLVNAEGKILGRLATQIATLLRGKDNPRFARHVDTGAFVVVVNAEKIRLTGRKMEQETYDYYTYYPGGHKIVPIGKLMKTHPDRVLRLAVRRMLPKNKLATTMLKRLKIYRGTEHPHAAQQPQPLTLTRA